MEYQPWYSGLYEVQCMISCSQTRLQADVDQLNANVNTLGGGVEELKNQVTDKIKEEKEAVSTDQLFYKCLGYFIYRERRKQVP